MGGKLALALRRGDHRLVKMTLAACIRIRRHTRIPLIFSHADKSPVPCSCFIPPVRALGHQRLGLVQHVDVWTISMGISWDIILRVVIANDTFDGLTSCWMMVRDL
ncbi:hypothetical protein SDJN03_15501, partial [Cucurbita argyrosperma subsp. sororia]